MEGLAQAGGEELGGASPVERGTFAQPPSRCGERGTRRQGDGEPGTGVADVRKLGEEARPAGLWAGRIAGVLRLSGQRPFAEITLRAGRLRA